MCTFSTLHYDAARYSHSTIVYSILHNIDIQYLRICTEEKRFPSIHLDGPFLFYLGEKALVMFSFKS